MFAQEWEGMVLVLACFSHISGCHFPGILYYFLLFATFLVEVCIESMLDKASKKKSTDAPPVLPKPKKQKSLGDFQHAGFHQIKQTLKNPKKLIITAIPKGKSNVANSSLQGEGCYTSATLLDLKIYKG